MSDYLNLYKPTLLRAFPLWCADLCTKPALLGRHLYRRLSVWRQRSRQRRALAGLTAHQLDDIGISRRAAVNEAGKPFWRP